MDQFGGKLGGPIRPPLRVSVFEGDVLSFYIAKLVQSPTKCFGTGGLTNSVAPRKISYSKNLLWLLRSNRSAKRKEQTPKGKTECAPDY
jgi:hypothetical protein